MNEFIGTIAIKKLQQEQLDLFRAWAQAGDWNNFHSNHYDWWAFPISKPSSYGFRFTIGIDDISELMHDKAFIANLRECASLVFLSWGWELSSMSYVDHPHADQRWQNWPIRLKKCNESLAIFGQDDYVRSSREFAKILYDSGHSFEYLGRNLYLEIH